MRIEVSSLVRAPPDEVWAWWTNYGEVGSKERVDHGFGWTLREIVSRDKGRVVMREHMPGGIMHMDHDVVINEEGRFMEEHFVGGSGWPFTSVWRFESADEGRVTRITRVLTAESRVPEFILGALEPVTRRAFARDLATHVRAFEVDRAAGGA